MLFADDVWAEMVRVRCPKREILGTVGTAQSRFRESRRSSSQPARDPVNQFRSRLDELHRRVAMNMFVTGCRAMTVNWILRIAGGDELVQAH
jgi:hypothetical protein